MNFSLVDCNSRLLGSRICGKWVFASSTGEAQYNSVHSVCWAEAIESTPGPPEVEECRSFKDGPR